MENSLIDKKMLGEYVEALIRQKYPNLSDYDFNKLKEDGVAKLNHEILLHIFGYLDREQLKEMNALIDRGEENPEPFQAIFDRAGINIEQQITAALDNFKKEFMEVQNV